MFLAAENNNADSTGYYLQLFYVFVVLAIIVALIVLLARFLGKKNRSWMQGRTIKTLGAVGVGQNKSVQLLEVGGSIYLIGVGEDITLIDKISDPEQAVLIKALVEQEQGVSAGPLPPFIDKLAARLRKQPPPEDVVLEDTTSFHEVFESKLRNVPSRKQRVEEILREDQKNQ